MTRFGENFAFLATFNKSDDIALKVYLAVCQNFNGFGQFFISVNGQIWNKLFSHRATMTRIGIEIFLSCFFKVFFSGKM